MTRTNKKYDEEYKKNIVKLIESGKSISDIEREYGIGRKNIYNWKYKYGTIVTTDGTVTNNDELDKIKKENKLLKQENEILKKPLPYSRRNK